MSQGFQLLTRRNLSSKLRVVNQSTIDPVATLEEHFIQRKQKNPKYSLRAYARDLGVSPGQLSKVMGRSREITYRQISKFASALRLKQTETKRLIEAAILRSHPKAKVKRSLRRKTIYLAHSRRKAEFLEIDEVSVEKFKAISQWYHLAILELTYIETFQNDPAWISSRLGISKIEAKFAVDRLLKLGFLYYTAAGKLKKTSDHLMFNTHKPEPEIRLYEKTMIRKANEALDQDSLEAFHQRLINSITFPSSTEALPSIKKAIYDFQKNIFKIIKDHRFEKVYQLNCQFFPLSQQEKLCE